MVLETKCTTEKNENTTAIFPLGSFLFPTGLGTSSPRLPFPGVGDRKDKMEGDNHFQERNSRETRRVLLRLYLGGSRGYYDSFFATPRL